MSCANKTPLPFSSCRKWTGKSAAELKSQLTRLKGMLDKESSEFFIALLKSTNRFHFLSICTGNLRCPWPGPSYSVRKKCIDVLFSPAPCMYFCKTPLASNRECWRVREVI